MYLSIMLTAQSLLFISNLIIHSCAQCYESSWTIESVQNCPKTTEEWMHSAALKNCSSVSQNCTSEDKFQYHCVRDSFLSKLIEVCAPLRKSAGYCIEYDKKGSVIQDNYLEPCTDFQPKCSVGYLSTQVYKYPKCYELSKIAFEEPSNSSSNQNPNELPFISIGPEVIGILCAACVVIVMGLTIGIVKKRMKNGKNDPPLTSNTRERDMDLSNTNKCMDESDNASSTENVNNCSLWEKISEGTITITKFGNKVENSNGNHVVFSSKEEIMSAKDMNDFEKRNLPEDSKNVRSKTDDCTVPSQKDTKCSKSDEINCHELGSESKIEKDNSQTKKDTFNSSQRSTETISSGSELLSEDMEDSTRKEES